MIASRVRLETLQAAADTIGVRFDFTTLNASGTRHRVKLYPLTPAELYRPACKWHREQGRPDACRCRRKRGEDGDAKYQRVSARGNDARCNAVCWHGFRDFFRAVYHLEPAAHFATAMDTWRGAEDFEARFRESGHRNIGSQMFPIAAAEACRCPESGYIDGAPAQPQTQADRDRVQAILLRAEVLAQERAAESAERAAACAPQRAEAYGADMAPPDGISGERWADYNRKMNDLLMRGVGQ